jgi:hypothetical protein
MTYQRPALNDIIGETMSGGAESERRIPEMKTPSATIR